MTESTQTDAPDDRDEIGIETLMQQIDDILERMEAPDAPLESTIRDFETGMTLMRRAQGLLEAAEQRVEILLSENAGGDAAADSG